MPLLLTPDHSAWQTCSYLPAPPPDAFGIKLDHREGPDFARTVLRQTPLYSTGDRACEDDPLDTDREEDRVGDQEVVRLLLSYGA